MGVAALLAVSVIMSYMGSEAAREAGDASFAQMMRNNANAADLLRVIDPTLLDTLSPDELQELQTVYEGLEYNPEMVQYIQGVAPEMYAQWEQVKAQTVQDSPEARDMQVQALSNIQKRTEEGLSAEDQAQFLKNERDAGEFARGREQAVTEDAQRRGAGGSGMEFSLRSGGGQDAADRLSQSGADRAASAARERALANVAQMQGASQLRGADISLGKTNADILNEFAWNNATKKQMTSNANTDLRNKFSESETAERRDVMREQVRTGNEADKFNINLRGQEAQSRNQNLLTQYQAKENALNNKYKAIQDKQQLLAGNITGQMPILAAKGAQDAGYAAYPYQAGASAAGAGASYAYDSDVNNPKYDPKTGKKIKRFDPDTGDPIN